MRSLHVNQYPFPVTQSSGAGTLREQEKSRGGGRDPYLQEGEGQGVLAATQQRLTLIQRLVVQCDAIDLGPNREPVRPAARTRALPACQPGWTVGWFCKVPKSEAGGGDSPAPMA